MANIRELKKLNEDFQEISKRNAPLDIKSTILEDTNVVDSFNSNRTQQYISKLEVKEKKFYVCKESGKVSLSGSGNITIEIQDSIDLTLEFLDNAGGALNVNILVKENQTLNLLTYLNTKNFVFVNVFLEKSAQCRISEQIREVPLFICDLQLSKNSFLELNATYLVSDTSSYIHNMVEHKGEHSSSDMNIQGLAMKNAQVTNDGFVLINQNSPNSSGHQYMKNILVDKSSKISSEPILEIKNSEVKCSHGSSISQISEQLEFYMQSRGLTRDEVLSLIAQGFVESSLNVLENNNDKFDFDNYRNKMLEFLD